MNPPTSSERRHIRDIATLPLAVKEIEMLRENWAETEQRIAAIKTDLAVLQSQIRTIRMVLVGAITGLCGIVMELIRQFASSQ